MMTAPHRHRKEAEPPRPGKSRLYLQHFGAHVVRLLPGETYTTSKSDEAIVTVLGSCVSACIRDPKSGFGGMNHFMLPESSTGRWGEELSAAMRYGNFAMEDLINSVLKSGCARKDLEIKLFGGANFTQGVTMIGQKNGDFALSYLKNEGLRPVAMDLGGALGRRIEYHPATGKVARLFLRGTGKDQVVEEERRYGAVLRSKPVEGDVQLFD
ncbi:MAG: chemoreceptor glutamine deamidase CheD [Rhodomicrobium sp.]|jgi:chemotaxis protein CheD